MFYYYHIFFNETEASWMGEYGCVKKYLRMMGLKVRQYTRLIHRIFLHCSKDPHGNYLPTNVKIPVIKHGLRYESMIANFVENNISITNKNFF